MRASFVVMFASLIAAIVPAASGCRSRAPSDAAARPRIVFADPAAANDAPLEEPTSALDPTLAADVRATLRGDGRTELDIRTPIEWGRPTARRLRVARAEAAPATDVRIKVVAELPGSAIVIVDEYTAADSSAPCRSKDAFLRVIAVAGPNARETFKRRVGSCRGDVRLATSSPLTWNPLAATLEARWSKGAPFEGATPAEEILERVRIKGDGSVTPSSS